MRAKTNRDHWHLLQRPVLLAVYFLIALSFSIAFAAENPDETVSREYLGFAEVTGFRGVIDDPDGYVNLRKEKGTDAPVITKVKAGEPFSFECKEDDEWCKVKLRSGKSGWMHFSRIRLFFTKNDLPGKPTKGDEIDEQASKHGVNYYEATQGAVRGDKEALKKFFGAANYADGAGAEEHWGVLGVVIHLIGDDSLAKFLSSQPLSYQMMVRNSFMSGDPTFPFEPVEYLQRHFPKTARIFFRREIDFPSPDGRYGIHKRFSDEGIAEDSKVTRSEAIEKATGKVVKDLTAEDKGRGLDREGSVEWAPDSKGFLFFSPQPGSTLEVQAYRLPDKSFVKVEVPCWGDTPASRDPEVGDAVFDGVMSETIHWSKANTITCEKTCRYKSTDSSGAAHHLERTYEITMMIGSDGKVTTEQKRIEKGE